MRFEFIFDLVMVACERATVVGVFDEVPFEAEHGSFPSSEPAAADFFVSPFAYPRFRFFPTEQSRGVVGMGVAKSVVELVSPHAAK